MSSSTPLEITLAPGRSERNYWRDLWRYRELLQVLAWRDVAVRYKQTAIGVAWAIIRPLLTMAVFVAVFGRVAKLPSDGAAPYSLMVFVGLLPWTFFSTALSEASNSLVSNANLVSKVYFPRLIVPTASIAAAFVDFLVTFGLIVVMMIWYQHSPNWRILALPLFTLLAFFTALGPGLLLASLNVKFRDVRYVIPFIVQVGLYLSPVGFSSSVIPVKWRLLYSLNPMVGVIDGFRWSLLGRDSQLYLPGLVLGPVIATTCFWLGLRHFRRTERAFADLI